MTPLSIGELRAPYEYVIAESHVRDAQRLLVEGGDDANTTSVTIRALRPSASILALAGLGRDIWRGVDPLKYVQGLRDEWDAR